MSRVQTAGFASATGPLFGVVLLLVALFRPSWITTVAMACARFWDAVATPALAHWLLRG